MRGNGRVVVDVVGQAMVVLFGALQSTMEDGVVHGVLSIACGLWDAWCGCCDATFVDVVVWW